MSRHRFVMPLSTVLLVMLTLGVTGCTPGDGDPGEGGDGDGGEVDFDEFVEDYDELHHSAYCEGLWECPEWQPLREQTGWHYSQYATLNECLAGTQLPEFRDSNFGVAESVESGRMVFDGEAASGCLTAMRRGLTDDFCGDSQAQNDIEDACDGVFTGALADGEYCLRSEECEADSTCEGIDGECYGTCEPIEPEGCGDGPACGEGEFCSMSGECADYVDPDSGEDCGIGAPCPEEYHCVDEQCVAERSLQEGQGCSEHSLCSQGLYCDFETETCEPKDWGAEGDSCFIYNLPVCDPGLGCEIEDVGTGAPGSFEASCVPQQPQGGPCTWANECQADLFCDTEIEFETTGTCEERLELGEPCHRNTECQSFTCSFPGDGSASGECAEDTSPGCELPDGG